MNLICLSWFVSLCWLDFALGQNIFGWSITEIEEPEGQAQSKSLFELVMAEQFDYPVLENTTNYTSRLSCIDKLDEKFDKFFVGNPKTIRREPHWFEVYQNGGRYVLVCDYNYDKRHWELNVYWDDNNNIPPRWFMLRNSIDAILGTE